jgi:hypothetical protein
MAQAVASYQFELGRSAGEKKKGLRTVCIEIKSAYFTETGLCVRLDYKMLSM